MKVAFAFLFLSLGLFGFSQNDSIQKIPFVAYWSNGDSYDYLITKVNKEWKGDLMEKNDSTPLMRIPASLFCYWLGESEIHQKSILVL